MSIKEERRAVAHVWCAMYRYLQWPQQVSYLSPLHPVECPAPVADHRPGVGNQSAHMYINIPIYMPNVHSNANAKWIAVKVAT